MILLVGAGNGLPALDSSRKILCCLISQQILNLTTLRNSQRDNFCGIYWAIIRLKFIFARHCSSDLFRSITAGDCRDRATQVQRPVDCEKPAALNNACTVCVTHVKKQPQML
jgi:hypothetical protein